MRGRLLENGRFYSSRIRKSENEIEETAVGQQSLKPVGLATASQRLILTGERSGLQTRIATTASVTLFAQMSY